MFSYSSASSSPKLCEALHYSFLSCVLWSFCWWQGRMGQAVSVSEGLSLGDLVVWVMTTKETRGRFPCRSCSVRVWSDLLWWWSTGVGVLVSDVWVCLCCFLLFDMNILMWYSVFYWRRLHLRESVFCFGPFQDSVEVLNWFFSCFVSWFVFVFICQLFVKVNYEDEEKCCYYY